MSSSLTAVASSMMEPKSMNVSSRSLEVPSVQELAKKKPSVVPSKYIRRDQQSLLPYSFNYPLPKLPVIDLQKLLDESSMDSELQVLHNACQEWGFFQLINHEVDSSVIEKMKLEIQNFFNLPMEEKNKFHQQPGDLQGYGQVFIVSEETKLDWGDRLFVIASPPYMRKPDLIPNLPPTFGDAIGSYSSKLKILSMKILKQMAKALNMREQEMKILFDEGVESMRMNYYPPCPQPELVTGFYPHSDANALTILLQANETDGLQIKKDGAWIPVTPLPNAFIINIGDVLEIVTNGIYKSIEHRVTTNSKKERLSIAVFFSPKMDGDLGPSPSLISCENPARFRRIVTAEYFNGLYSKEIAGKTHLDTMRI